MSTNDTLQTPAPSGAFSAWLRQLPERSEAMNYDLAIKPNNCATNDPCAICGERTDPSSPIALFPVDSWQPVCDVCGERYAPELLRLVDVFYAIQGEVGWGHEDYEERVLRALERHAGWSASQARAVRAAAVPRKGGEGHD